MGRTRMAEDARQGPLRVGDKFLKYEIRGLVGKGGHAWVYHGHDPFLEQTVAIKVLHRPGGVTEDMRRRGQAEARLLYRLKHPHIVEVVDAGITEQGLLYIVMPLLEGRTLRDIVRARNKIPIAEALPLFLQMTDGVAAAHGAGVIHRDLKPENVFVLYDNTPKILDFGIAKVVDSAGFTTEKDVLHGTLLYMSPEQLDGYRATARSDVYALGLMLYEVLLGTHPCLLRNPSPTVRELALIHKVSVPPWLNELDPAIPTYIARVVDRAITKLPEQRFESMAAFGAAIRDCLAQFRALGRSNIAPGLGRTVPLLHAGAHDTERIDVQKFASDPHLPAPPALPLPSGERTEQLEDPSTRNTVQPVTTRSALAHRSELESPLGARRTSLLRVLIGGAVAGTLVGVAASFLVGPKDQPEAGAPSQLAPSARSAPAPTAPPSIAAARPVGTSRPAASVAAPSGSVAKMAQEAGAARPIELVPATAARRAAEPESRTRSAPSTSGEASEPKRKQRDAARANPDREVWIE